MLGSKDFANANLERSAAQEGWREAPGWCWSRNRMELDQHHPVCAYWVASPILFSSCIHPSSAEEGTLLFFIHIFIDRAPTSLEGRALPSKVGIVFDEGSQFKTASGIGIGDTEERMKAVYRGQIRVEAHHDTDRHYLI